VALAVVLSECVWALSAGAIAHRKLPRRGDVLAAVFRIRTLAGRSA
jgi:hypothetical protein